MEATDYLERMNANTRNVLETGHRVGHHLTPQRHATGWSATEIIEHLCICDELITGMLSGPADGTASHAYLLGENKLKKMLVDDPTPMASPSFTLPTRTLTDMTRLLERFKATRTKLGNNVATGKITMDNRFYHNPLLGNMTVRDWLLFIIYHAERHIGQLQRLG